MQIVLILTELISVLCLAAFAFGGGSFVCDYLNMDLIAKAAQIKIIR